MLLEPPSKALNTSFMLHNYSHSAPLILFFFLIFVTLKGQGP